MASTAGTTETVPTTAERIRSIWLRAQALLAVEGVEPVAAPVCHLLADGSVAVAVPTGESVPDPSDAGVQAMLELTDHAPLPLRERVRALVWVRGRLHPVPAHEIDALLDRIAAEDPHPALLGVRSPRSTASARLDDPAEVRYTLLRLTTESVVVADATGAESVALTDLLAARPDPLCAIEAAWLRHVDSAHPEVVARLASRLPAGLRRGQVRPLAIDRHGVWLRVEGADGDRDVRLPFGRPVTDVAGLNRAVRALMGCPFHNGLHARRP